jgi:hypothetical protein
LNLLDFRELLLPVRSGGSRETVLTPGSWGVKLSAMKLVALACAFLLLLPASAADDKNKNKDKDQDPDAVAALSFLVRRDAGGKPVVNAVVVLHEVNDKGQQAKGGVELKTDLDGKASYEGVPYGKIRVQVLANGFQTFGADYDVNQPTVAISISLKRPQPQYSVYDDQSREKRDGNPPQ